ncbi:hypothetical protein MMPV_004318 [Pyropia vietnamensis]
MAFAVAAPPRLRITSGSRALPWSRPGYAVTGTPPSALSVPRPCRAAVRVTMASSPLPLPSPPAAPKSVVGANPIFAQTMLRIADPTRSAPFYTDILGMSLLTTLEFPDLKFSLYFYGYPPADEEPAPPASAPQADRAAWLWARPYPTVELTHNWGTEDPASGFGGYDNGNDAESGGRGYGHLGVIVDDPVATVGAMEAAGVKVTRPASPFQDVGVLGFVADPDGYLVEIIRRERPATAAEGTSGGASPPSTGLVGPDPVLAQTMLRVRDPGASVAFYRRLGLTYLTSLSFDSFSLHFLGAPPAEPPVDAAGSDDRPTRASWLWAFRTPTVELTHNHGTETDPEFGGYHNGNSEPRGFGHLGFIVSDVGAAVEALRAAGHKVVREAGPFADAGVIAFVADPDGYLVELIQREGGEGEPYAKPI